MDQSITRVLSLILALGVVLGVVWFVEQDETRLKEAASRSARQPARVAVPEQDPYRRNDAADRAAPVRGGKTIYTCSNDGETVISDRPCGNVIATHAAQSAVSETTPRVRSYREQYDNLVSQRTQSHQAQSSPSVVSERERERARRAQRCAELDRRIESLDAQARLPQSGQSQDRLRQARQRVMDERAKVCR